MADHIELYRDTEGQWRWRRWAPNGNIVATSGEGYVRRIDCLEQAQHANPGVEVRTTEG